MEDNSPTRRYRGVANLLAIAAIASGNYTLIDSLANALNAETVRRVVYVAFRNTDTMIQQNKIAIMEKKDDKGRNILEAVINGRNYIFYGMANEEQCRNFLEEASSDVSLARKIGAFAMSIIASRRWSE